jgi:hypothetical protein
MICVQLIPIDEKAFEHVLWLLNPSSTALLTADFVHECVGVEVLVRCDLCGAVHADGQVLRSQTPVRCTF